MASTGTMARVHASATEDGRPLVLVALEPPTYAHVVGKAVADLRPAIRVVVNEAGESAAEAARRLSPALVLCSAPCPDPLLPGTRWVEFGPYDEPETLRVDGRNVPPRADRGGVDLEDILWIVDWAAFARRKSGTAPRSGPTTSGTRAP